MELVRNRSHDSSSSSEGELHETHPLSTSSHPTSPVPPRRHFSLFSFIFGCLPLHCLSEKKEPKSLIPRQTSKHLGRHTLVLDLDETLLHTSLKPISCDFEVSVQLPNRTRKYYVLKRPGLDEFLKTCTSLFEVVIFTASRMRYAKALMNTIDPDHNIPHILARDSCLHIENGYIKDLSRLGRDLHKVIVIDVILTQNSPNAYQLQPFNAIPISTWTDDKSDRELSATSRILMELAGVDVPKVLKEVQKSSWELSEGSVHSIIVSNAVSTTVELSDSPLLVSDVRRLDENEAET
jgi:carboxy-terminal domain RNA polymerase II polypeptide A small phosphatase